MKKVPPVDKGIRIWKMVGFFFFGLVLLAALWECHIHRTVSANRLMAREVKGRSVLVPERAVKKSELGNREKISLDLLPTFDH